MASVIQHTGPCPHHLRRSKVSPAIHFVPHNCIHTCIARDVTVRGQQWDQNFQEAQPRPVDAVETEPLPPRADDVRS